MARYIDADALLERMRLTYCKDCNNYNEIMCRSCLMDDALTTLEDCHTADVAPKSEVERLTVELDAMRGAANSYKMHHEKLKELNAVLEADIVNANMNLEHITYEYDLLKQEKSVVRAEAVWEFAERLKKYYASLNGKTAAGCVEYHVDQIAKEMIGETK